MSACADFTAQIMGVYRRELVGVAYDVEGATYFFLKYVHFT